MPITKKNDWKRYLEDFEEIDEHSPFFEPSYIEEEEFYFEENTLPVIPFWKKCWVLLKSFF